MHAIGALDELHPAAPVTHIGDSLKQLADETADLPIGAVVLLSDGADNSGGIDQGTIAALRNRHIPVHTVGFGLEQVPHDVEISDVVVAPRALADSRLSAARQPAPARLCRAQDHAHGARRRQSPHQPAHYAGRGRRGPDRSAAVQRRRRGSENAEFFGGSAAG